eukprot:6181344-Pleurochrysis_carterae.AAC.1
MSVRAWERAYARPSLAHAVGVRRRPSPLSPLCDGRRAAWPLAPLRMCRPRVRLLRGRAVRTQRRRRVLRVAVTPVLRGRCLSRYLSG